MGADPADNPPMADVLTPNRCTRGHEVRGDRRFCACGSPTLAVLGGEAGPPTPAPSAPKPPPYVESRERRQGPPRRLLTMVGVGVIVVVLAALAFRTFMAGEDAAEAPSGELLSLTDAQATDLLLRSTDFPAGWTATAPKPDSGVGDDQQIESESERQFDACLADAGAPIKYVIDKESPEFSQGDLQVSGQLQVTGSMADYQREVALVRDPKIGTCIAGAIKSGFQEEGMTVGDVQVTPFDVPSHGDVSEAFRMVIPVTSEGVALTLQMEAVFYGVRGAEASLLFASVNTPVDPGLRTQVLDNLGARLDALAAA